MKRKYTAIELLDCITFPDIRLILNSDYVIIGCEAVTTAGADYLLHNAILEKKYDDVSFPELWVETNSPEEE